MYKILYRYIVNKSFNIFITGLFVWPKYWTEIIFVNIYSVLYSICKWLKNKFELDNFFIKNLMEVGFLLIIAIICIVSTVLIENWKKYNDYSILYNFYIVSCYDLY